MRKGQVEPDARIDLHGMTAERAHAALTAFVANSHTAGRRCVLVITGKGGRRFRDAEDLDGFGGARDGMGVLRRLAPEWLASPPLSGFVATVAPAHIRHGGDGALYVYLRKRPPRRR